MIFSSPQTSDTSLNMIQIPPNVVDTEMIYPLTSTNPNRGRSASPESAEMADSFKSARERGERLASSRGTSRGRRNSSRNGGNSGGRDATGNGGNPPESSTPPSNTLGPILDEVPLSDVNPGPVYPTENQLDVAYAYGIRRESGRFTRLIPADQLPALEGIDEVQGSEGLIILPEPRAASPARRPDGEQVASSVVQTLPLLPPFRRNALHDHSLGQIIQAVNPNPSGDITQETIDTIIARASISPSSSSLIQSRPVHPQHRERREKVYCDKWVHEGTCAFTQVGCKYKHEMPMDKATQLSLGLTHGIPGWYRRLHAVQLRPEGPISPPAITNPRTNGPWRRPESDTRQITSSQFAVSRRTSFGPIGPPATRQTDSSTSSTFSALNSSSTAIKYDDDDDEDTSFRWAGRGYGR
ncbi:hypothetical protein B7494_g1452 [Chlorociboria aeruginascens]|nr:hypothetical protein B7494_g1452 [Chlorociboria aeruginascens]